MSTPTLKRKSDDSVSDINNEVQDTKSHKSDVKDISLSGQIDDNVWKTKLGVEDLSTVDNHVQINILHTVDGMSNNDVYIPSQISDRVIKISTQSGDGRTVRIQGSDSFPNVETLDLGDGLVLPRYNHVDIPAEFEENPFAAFIMNKHKDIKKEIGAVVFVSAFANRSNDQSGDTMIKMLSEPSSEAATEMIPYRDIGRIVYPSLHNLSMTMYQHYGLQAGIQSLGTMSHLDGELSLFIRDVGDWISGQTMKIMQQFLRFPKVKVLRLCLWERVYGPHRQGYEPVSEDFVATVFGDISVILNGLFGHKDQKWTCLERIELDLLSECANSSVPLKPLLKHYFPKEEWFQVIKQSPNLKSIGHWNKTRLSYVKNRARLSIDPFIYSLEIEYPLQRKFRNDYKEQIATIIKNSASECPIDKKTIYLLVKKCEKCECCKFYSFSRFVDYSKPYPEISEQCEADRLYDKEQAKAEAQAEAQAQAKAEATSSN